MFWIEFDKSVTEEDTLSFMKKRLTSYGTFVSCGRFAKRVIGVETSGKDMRKTHKITGSKAHRNMLESVCTLS